MINNMWKNEIEAIGINAGDTIFIRASLKAIAPEMKGNRIATSIITTLLDVVGSGGTIIAPSYSNKFLLFKKNPNIIYSDTCHVATGGFSNALLKWPGAIRSIHPTNSHVAVGANKSYLLNEHGPNSFCFFPTEKLIELDGKMLLIGCIEDNPGFPTVHLIQYELGLSTKSLLSNKFGAYYYNDVNQLCLFKKTDIPGCSKGFNKFYQYYEKQGVLRKGYIGEAYSYCVNAKDAYSIEYPLIKENPTFPLCDDVDCIICRGSWYYNLKEWPRFYFSYKRFRHIFKQISTDKRLSAEQIHEAKYGI